MEKVFALIGKVALILVLLTVGYLVGSRFSTKGQSVPEPEAPSASLTADTLNKQPTIAPTQVTMKIVTSGLGNIAGVNFPKYTIEIPPDWGVTQEHSEKESPVDTLIVTKGDYQLKVFQAATGGTICLYPGDAEIEGPNVRFADFSKVDGVSGVVFRRSVLNSATPGNSKTVAVCQKSETYGNFQQPTSFGHVSYKVPITFNEEIIKEMDAMIASLKKI